MLMQASIDSGKAGTIPAGLWLESAATLIVEVELDYPLLTSRLIQQEPQRIRGDASHFVAKNDNLLVATSDHVRHSGTVRLSDGENVAQAKNTISAPEEIDPQTQSASEKSHEADQRIISKPETIGRQPTGEAAAVVQQPSSSLGFQPITPGTTNDGRIPELIAKLIIENNNRVLGLSRDEGHGWNAKAKALDRYKLSKQQRLSIDLVRNLLEVDLIFSWPLCNVLTHSFAFPTGSSYGIIHTYQHAATAASAEFANMFALSEYPTIYMMEKMASRFGTIVQVEIPSDDMASERAELLAASTARMDFRKDVMKGRTKANVNKVVDDRNEEFIDYLRRSQRKIRQPNFVLFNVHQHEGQKAPPRERVRDVIPYALEQLTRLRLEAHKVKVH
ncbi:hypothetical protein HK102_010132 [Quaeritorhiza haematococci]|nr:hypothetical protein HK102_010132 [Quaeritorhiza haematococci]